MSKMDTVVVLVSDVGYLDKAKRTIEDIRSIGRWWGPLVWIAVDFEPPEKYCKFYRITVKHFPRIDTRELVEKIKKRPYLATDTRETTRLTQWEKLHVFDEYFWQFSKVMYFDAGMRVLEDIKVFLDLDCDGKFLCQTDHPGEDFRFAIQLEKNDDYVELKREYPEIETSHYFLNTLWIYDTRLKLEKREFVDMMNKYTLWRTNEMGVMNMVINIKRKMWEPLPICAPNGKMLVEYCETNHPGTTWDDYCAIKYAATIDMRCM